ncbi:MAG TPA: hypothetical protein VFY56_01620 [Propionibacteriaceae bacterium]|nr:hypothetical protein [Propionibacteriaceae bacterium]
MFFRAADGIRWLDTSISRRWNSAEAVRAEIDTVAGQDAYLLAGLALAAEARVLRPGPDQVFDFAVAPLLGIVRNRQHRRRGLRYQTYGRRSAP